MDLDFRRLLERIDALNNPHRLRILAMLAEQRVHVSELARRLELGRPLVYLHLGKLEAAGLIRGASEISTDGKSMKYHDVVPFDLRLNVDQIVRLVREHEGDR